MSAAGLPRRDSWPARSRRPHSGVDPVRPVWPVEKIQDVSLEKHLPLIDEAGKQASRSSACRRSSTAPTSARARIRSGTTPPRRSRGPTTEVMQALARKHQMAMVVPVYEREQAGVYYNTAAVIDADGSYLGKYRKNHIPHTNGFWEKYFFKPGNLGYPVVPDPRTRRSASTSATTATSPRGRASSASNGAEIVFNPSATVAGLSQYLWKLEQPAHAVANGYFVAASNRVGTEAPVEHRQVLRHELLRRPARQLPRDRERGQGRARRRPWRPRPDRGGAPHLAVLPRPQAGDVRRDGEDLNEHRNR